MALTITMDFTAQNIWSLCPQKGSYYLIQGLRPKRAAPAPYFGICIHEALQQWHDPRLKHQATHECVELMRIFATEAASRTITSRDDHSFAHMPSCAKCSTINAFLMAAFDNISPLIELETINNRSIASGLKILDNYMRTFPADEDEYKTQLFADGTPMTEKVFTVQLSEHLFYKGRIDGGWERKRDGRHFIVDHKTTSQLGPMFLAKAKPNHQYTGYLLMAKLLDIPAEGLIINAINTSKTAHDGKKRNKTTPIPFDRFITKRTNEEFEIFIADMEYKAEMMRGYIKAGHFPMNAPDACVSYNSKCEFIELCSSAKKTHKSLIEANYVVDHWMGWETGKV